MESKEGVGWLRWIGKIKKIKILMGWNFENQERIRRIGFLGEKLEKDINWVRSWRVTRKNQSPLNWRWKIKRRNYGDWGG